MLAVIFSESSASEEDFPKHQVLWDRCIWCAVCLLSALRCLERTNRAGRLLLSVYREEVSGNERNRSQAELRYQKYFLLAGFPGCTVWTNVILIFLILSSLGWLRCKWQLLKVCFWKRRFEANTAWILCCVGTTWAVFGLMVNLLE